MIEPSMIDQDELSSLAGMYTHGVFLYGPLETLTSRKKKKFCKWMKKLYSKSIKDFSMDVQACFDPENEDDTLLSFLADCYAQLQLRSDLRRENFIHATASLDDDVRNALYSLCDEDEYVAIYGEDDQCVMVLADTPAFRRKLILKGLDGVCQLTSDSYLIDIPKVERTVDHYIFMAKTTGEDFSVVFSQAAIQVESFNCMDAAGAWDDPWGYLHMLAGLISYKAQVCPAYCNDLEIDLLPLLGEITDLQDSWKDKVEFSLLKKMAVDFGFQKIADALNKLEAMPGRKRVLACRRLTSMLCRQEYESLWRSIFDRIKASQADYPNKMNICYANEALEKKRFAVQKIFEGHGFVGQYPDFSFCGPISGLHLEGSYDQSYVIAGERNVVSHIHCVEGCDCEDKLAIHYLCGIQFLRKDEKPGDIYSCLFNARGRRLFRWIKDYRLLYAPAKEPDMDERLAQIAIKKVRLQPLTRQEKKIFSAGSGSAWGLFWLFFLFGGAMFGILMTLAMMLLGSIFITISGGFSELPQIISEFPWGYMLMFYWASFGVTMGVISMLAARKK